MPLRTQLSALLRLTHSILFLTLLAACASLPTSDTSIIKSPNDARAYRSVQLDNGLVAVLVSDPSSDKAAAALTVYRGQYDDPANRAGLAHFLEHMLFLGTAKYPDVDDYQNYITTNGGTFNAYTSSDHTNFFFDVRPDHFDGALDRFAQFFIAPTFDAAYVEREKNAVNSEYQLYFKDDGWRANHVEKQVMNPAHPGRRFSVGSLEHARRRRAHRPDRVLSHALFGGSDGARRARQSVARRTQRVGDRKVLSDSATAGRAGRADGSDIRAGFIAAEADVSDRPRRARGRLQLPGARTGHALPRKARRLSRRSARTRRRG